MYKNAFNSSLDYQDEMVASFIAMAHAYAKQVAGAAKFNECPVSFYDAVQLMLSFRLQHQDPVMKLIQTAIVD